MIILLVVLLRNVTVSNLSCISYFIKIDEALKIIIFDFNKRE